jgi:hypothetical protein
MPEILNAKGKDYDSITRDNYPSVGIQGKSKR